MEITDFSNKFLDDIIKIETESFKRPWTADMFLSSAGNSVIKFKVVVEDGKAAGFCIYWIVGGETEILNIAVSPVYRRRSFGRKMLEYICGDSVRNGSGSVFLEVRAGNKAAINLYISHGFEKIGIRKKYYIEEDAIVLRKCIE